MEVNDVPDPKRGILIIGGGLAGQTAALHAAEQADVLLISNSPLDVSSSAWAQGGIAAAISALDSPEAHLRDTLHAGRGLCKRSAVNALVGEAPKAIEQLIDWGVQFERGADGFSLGQEGGHSHRRIVHAMGGATGRAVMKALTERVWQHPRIRVLTDYELLNLKVEDGRCHGAWLVELESRRRVFIRADGVILAMGGASAIYERTTNPLSSKGQGVALGYGAGAEVADMEFVQFHPTALAESNSGQRVLLISEAVRGEGAHLINADGERFMIDEHPMAELAPRDVFARAVAREIELTGAVYLSMRDLDATLIQSKFYSLVEALTERDFDLASDQIPVAPAAHYTIGGLKTDLGGRTNIDRLYACDEVASTGVHGANRLASNSLLECFVFGKAAGMSAISESRREGFKFNREQMMSVPDRAELEKLNEIEVELRALMSRNVGILRSRDGLETALEMMEQKEIYLKHKFTNSPERERLLNELLTAKLIARGALLREETRGSHARVDFPEEDAKWHRSNDQSEHREEALSLTASA